jgi:hypothetical protein
MNDDGGCEGPEEHCLDLEVENLALRERADDAATAQTPSAGRVRNGPTDAFGERLVTFTHRGRRLGREKELELARAHAPCVGRHVCPEGRDHEGLHDRGRSYSGSGAGVTYARRSISGERPSDYDAFYLFNLSNSANSRLSSCGRWCIRAYSFSLAFLIIVAISSESNRRLRRFVTARLGADVFFRRLAKTLWSENRK